MKEEEAEADAESWQKQEDAEVSNEFENDPDEVKITFSGKINWIY